MLKQPITVLVQATAAGPKGVKLRPGQVVSLEDSAYTRILVKSGTVSLIDPASLDPDFLEKAGYELRDGYTHPTKEISSVENIAKEPSPLIIKRAIKNGAKVSEEIPISNERKDSIQKDGVKE